MLEELRIRGLGVIDDAVARFGCGLSVVTGETGAGKTMVVTGLQLLFGGRAASARVRSGAEQACVEGRLTVAPDSPVARRVADAGGELDEGGGLLLRRTVSTAGRSRAHAGGTATPVGVLAEVGAQVLTVHGQSDQMRLATPGEHRAVLDRFAGIDHRAYTAAYQRWQSAQLRLTERHRDLTALTREADLLAHGLGAIDAAAPEPGEDRELAAQSARLAHVDALLLASRGAHDALLGDADNPASDAADVHSLIGVAGRALSHAAGADAELDALADRLTVLATDAAELGADFASYAASLDADPARLAWIEDRRAELAALVRRYGDPEPEAGDGSEPGGAPDPRPAGAQGIDLVLRWAERARERLADLDTSDQALAELAARRDAARQETGTRASELTAHRRRAAAALAAAVTDEMHGLAMPAARLTVQVRARLATADRPCLVHPDGDDATAGPDGIDEVEFLLQPQPDVPPFPVQRGASGGELSRVMLALEVVLSASDPVPVLVFDEVDAGVGGRAAVEVGRRLARLARYHQVIVVTHLAQVAAFADHHLVVGGTPPAAASPAVDGRAVGRSDVREVSGDDRLAELARMLAGRDSERAREHAAELLADAADRPPT